jgi:pSer/pThr/pTyr-binding forkhead associated (FHA) protein
LGDGTASLPAVPGELRELTDDVGSIAGPTLVVRKGPEVGERFLLDRPTLSIGRDGTRDIFLNDVTVSRDHASLSIGTDGVTLKDAGSLNGTYVNGSRVDEAALSDGDSVQIGTFHMVFLAGGGS